jgi:long-subunit acyl-CoA synthetase (AMP-forming)
MVFVSRRIGFRRNDKIIQTIATKDRYSEGNSPSVVYLGEKTSNLANTISFDDFLRRGRESSKNILETANETSYLNADDVCCFQFTSGTTGPRKASMLSHK